MLTKHTCAICGIKFENHFKVQRCCSYTCRSKYIEKTWKDRFWKFVHKTETCWIWKGARSQNGKGYGILVRNRKFCPAHRVSYEIHFGKITDGHEICHKCDNPACVKPSHLFEGTHSENMKDCASKGRIFLSKISKSQAQNAAQLMRSGEPPKNIANKLNISPAHARKIRSGKCWK